MFDVKSQKTLYAIGRIPIPTIPIKRASFFLLRNRLDEYRVANTVGFQRYALEKLFIDELFIQIMDSKKTPLLINLHIGSIDYLG